MTAKELMISRYEAFKKKDWNYLVQTSTSQTLKDFRNSPDIKWLHLEILNNDEKTVEFKAYYILDKNVEVLHEKSFFAFENSALKYVDGKIFHSKVERNQICPCQSGKKFKKCCGKI